MRYDAKRPYDAFHNGIFNTGIIWNAMAELTKSIDVINVTPFFESLWWNLVITNSIQNQISYWDLICEILNLKINI